VVRTAVPMHQAGLLQDMLGVLVAFPEACVVPGLAEREGREQHCCFTGVEQVAGTGDAGESVALGTGEGVWPRDDCVGLGWYAAKH
jgi:hypothetical protein